MDLLKMLFFKNRLTTFVIQFILVKLPLERKQSVSPVSNTLSMHLLKILAQVKFYFKIYSYNVNMYLSILLLNFNPECFGEIKTTKD